MKQTPKLLLLVISCILLVSFAITGCNSSDKKETTTDTTVTPKMDATPAVQDTTKMDTARTRPTPTGN